jgi:predicted nucleic acid-binding protein
MESAYIETTVIGHLVGRLHTNAAIAARQQITRDWWVAAQSQFRMLISQVVVEECAAGDPVAAWERTQVTDSLSLLDISEMCHELANELMTRGAVPASEPRDSLHIATSAVYGVNYLVTWNFKHIANAAMRSRIEAVCRDAGFEPPIICTPEELSGERKCDG